MAVSLANEKLESQLVQLQENGLQHLPVYRTLESLQVQLDQIAATRMQDVTDLLAQGELQIGRERQDTLRQARREARRIVIQLMVEREQIRRRLQISVTLSFVGELIAAQSAVRGKAKELLSVARARAQSDVAEVFDDQNGVTAMLEQLVSTLEQAQDWSGATAADMNAALERCQDAGIRVLSRQAANAIGQSEFGVALERQDQVSSALFAVSRALQQARGIMSSNRATSVPILERLLAEQRRLLALTKQTDFGVDESKDRLAGEQRRIGRDLTQVDSLVIDAERRTALDNAQSASQLAEEALFLGRQDEAVRAESAVVDALVKLRPSQGLSATETTESVDPQAAAARLEELQKSVERALSMQEEVSEMAVEQPTEAAELEGRVAQELAGSAQSTRPAGDAAAAMQAARDAVASAKSTLEGNHSDQQRQRAVNTAEEALMELAARVAAASQLDTRQPATDSRSDSLSGNEQPAGAASEPQPTGQAVRGPNEESLTDNSAGGVPNSDATIDSRAGDDKVDSSLVPSQYRDLPWFVRLPPDLQRSILSRTRRPPPRSYESQLKRYFRTIE